MKKFVTSMVLFALLGAMTFAPVSAQSDHDHEHHHDSPVIKHMEVVGSNYKKLRRQARKKAFDDTTLTMVAEMQTNALAAMHLEFSKAAGLPAAEKKKMLLGFRKDMAEFIKALLDLEIALLEDRKDDAKQLISDLGRHKSAGHEKYTDESG